MVRIRKNANDLSEDERDRFLSAMVRLNSPNATTNTVGFLDILQMHSEPADPELHGRPAFLPWHRAYLLDLERRLQAIDPSVALPYWRFDRPAPNVFTRDFLGVPVANGILDFSSTNPMVNWRTRLPGQGNARLRRSNGLFFAGQFFPFDPTTQRALAIRNGQLDTLNLGADVSGDHTFTDFRRMEGDPHGAAHVSFTGAINNPATAPGDPLFFMLHCNVDRLWALWQAVTERYDEEDASAYPHQGAVSTNPPGNLRIGDFAHDTMWPWNQDVQAPRPPTAPGDQFPKGLLAAPNTEPRVGETIDFQGEIRKARNLGYAFDDVEFAH
jgi:tyrosinase